MRGAIAVILLAAGLVGCNPIKTFTEGMKYKNAVEKALEAETGVKPFVGFNWNNGKLTSVTVQFPRVYEAKPLSELANMVRSVVVKEFNATPDSIVLAFAIEK